jgi:hypothetical protein
MVRQWFCAGLIVAALGLASGCGTSGPARQRLQGEVSMNGQPVPAGVIVFTPDTSVGNSGPQGVATIKDGKFDTAASEGLGLAGGPTVIRVTGQGPDQSLLCEYEFRAELPKDDSTLKIEVPPTAARNRPPPAI